MRNIKRALVSFTISKSKKHNTDFEKKGVGVESLEQKKHTNILKESVHISENDKNCLEDGPKMGGGDGILDNSWGEGHF